MIRAISDLSKGGLMLINLIFLIFSCLPKKVNSVSNINFIIKKNEDLRFTAWKNCLTVITFYAT